LVFINRIVMESKSITQEVRNKHPLHKILLNTVKTVLLNELELVYFSIYLDKLGWESNGFSLEDNLLLTALAVKMYLNDNFKFIIEYLNRTKVNYLQQLNKWLETKKDYNVLSIAARDVNTRFNQLIKPSNPFCKTNFIDFNFVVDQILQMSIPYNDTKVHNSNHHTELSKFSFQNDNFVTKSQNANNTFGTQNSMFSKFIPNILNQPKNLSLSQTSQDHLLNQLHTIREENVHYNHTKKTEDKNVSFNDNSAVKGNDIGRTGSGIFGGRSESDNLMVFMRDYSALNFNNISRENSNNLYGAANEDEKLPDNFFKNKQTSNQFQNLIAYKSDDYLEKNPNNQDKQEDKQNTQLKASHPGNNNDSHNKYKQPKNQDN